MSLPITQRSYLGVHCQLVSLNYSKSPMCSQQVYENATKPERESLTSSDMVMMVKVAYLAKFAFTLKFDAKLATTFPQTNQSLHTECLWG